MESTVLSNEVFSTVPERHFVPPTVNPRKSCRSFTRLETHFRMLDLALTFIGLGFNKTSRWKKLVRIAMGIFLHLFFAFRFSVFLFRVKKEHFGLDTGVFIISREVFVIFIWHLASAKMENLANLLKCILKISCYFPNLGSRKWDRLFYVALLSIYLFFIAVTILMTCVMTYSEIRNYIYITLFGTVLNSYHSVVVFLLYGAFNYYILVVSLTVSSTYIYACCCLKKMLTTCSQRLKKCRTHYDVELIYNSALKLYSVMEQLESAFSLCVLFVTIFNLLLAFTSFFYGLGYHNLKNTRSSITVGVVSWLIGNATSFVLICWCAFEVKGKLLNLKKRMQLRLINLKYGEKNARKLDLSIFDTASLTAGNFFHLTKSFPIAALGLSFTYGVLIVQTLNYEDPDEDQ
ncbi:uncharacterized protein CDAR_492101 [Caerostris darwini]|uniref:Gustatory receptor n=1 Tax=Caerostris darwini TaxID=1538125 RepID=A0AAV4VJB3_9ARAC|nr:uncharacterized protein CDAR_492101 [Caerostris darwini]